MTDTLWCDVSEYQCPVDNSYPYRWLSFRANDGTYRDPAFAANLAWSIQAANDGRLDGFIVYGVYEPDEDWVGTLIDMVGNPHPLMAVMIDLESWGGRISGDHSDDINAGRARLGQWLGSTARVLGYGNIGDLNGLWPNRGDTPIVLAAYDWNPDFPGKIAHQYTSSGSVAPFGSPVDVNSADGYDSPSLQALLGLGANLAGLNVAPFHPAAVAAPTQEADMPVFTDTDHTVYWPNGWYNSYDPGVYGALKAYFTNGGQILDGTAGTVQREVWAATNGIIAANAAAVAAGVATTTSAAPVDVAKLAAEILAGMPKTFTVTGGK